MTKQQLQDELRTSMLAKDVLKTSVLRLLLSALNYYEIQKGGANYQASEEDVLTIIQREVKQRRDSIEQFQNAGRKDLSDKEEKELAILQTYMPTQMSEDDIRMAVKAAVLETGAKTPQDMGKVMGVLVPKTKGKADGSMVSRIVREELGKI